MLFLKTLITLALLAPIAIQASPVYYTFEGTIFRSNDATIPVGTSVKHVWMIDWEMGGFQTQVGIDGFIRTGRDDEDFGYATRDYFYAEYIGGSALIHDIPGEPLPTDPPGTGMYSFNFGSNQVEHGVLISNLFGSNRDYTGSDFIYVEAYHRHIEDWRVGQSDFTGANTLWNKNAAVEIGHNLTLMRISTENPYEAVPEPASMALMGLGLAGLGIVFSCRKKVY